MLSYKWHPRIIHSHGQYSLAAVGVAREQHWECTPVSNGSVVSIREGKEGVFAVSIGSRVASVPLALCSRFARVLLACVLAWHAY